MTRKVCAPVLILFFMIQSCGSEDFYGKGDSADFKDNSADQESEATINESVDPELMIFQDARDREAKTLRACLKKWKQHPFPQETTFKRIYASVNVGSSGIAIDDTETTQVPELVLVYAGVNVNSNIEYNFLNPNAYYCLMVNVNVKSSLQINLHCNARLADSLVDVNVDSTTNGPGAAIGVSVSSDVKVNKIAAGDYGCVGSNNL